jgi:hypothetical protein
MWMAPASSCHGGRNAGWADPPPMSVLALRDVPLRRAAPILESHQAFAKV